MNRRRISGLVGMVVGGIWLLVNLRHVKDQGLVAIGLPLVFIALGVWHWVRGRDE